MRVERWIFNPINASKLCETDTANTDGKNSSCQYILKKLIKCYYNDKVLFTNSDTTNQGEARIICAGHR